MARINSIYDNFKKNVLEMSNCKEVCDKLGLASDDLYVDAMEAIDLAIQYMLLKVSFSDGNIEFREMDIIRSITQYGDYFKLYGPLAKWDKVYKKPKKLPEALDKMEALYKASEPYKFLVTFISYGTVYHKEGFSSLIKSSFEQMSLALAGADGNTDLNEVAAGVQFIEIVWRKVENTIREIKK